MAPADPAIAAACAILRAGGLVAFPTETVYGLGADASSPEAARRIFAAKGRPADHPLIVHLARIDQLADWAREVPDRARLVARHFWPGPLTLILKAAARVPAEVTGGQDTVGLRIPSHPVARALLEAFGGGIAGPSANRFGRISPTRAAHVHEELGGAVDLVLDGGPTDVGIESTILDLSGEVPRLLRPGAIRREQLEAVLGCAVLDPQDASPRVSGSLAAHYAPRCPLRLLGPQQLDEWLAQPDRAPAWVLARRPAPAGFGGSWVQLPADPEGYARALYARLRACDDGSGRTILVESPPRESAWLAVHDRLGRAAAGSGEQPPA